MLGFLSLAQALGSQPCPEHWEIKELSLTDSLEHWGSLDPLPYELYEGEMSREGKQETDWKGTGTMALGEVSC